MNTITAQYLHRPYTRILIPNEDGTYSAEILEFSGCFADGDTPNEAIENLTKAAESWIDVCLEQGQEIPEPFDNQDFGGKIALRLPRSLHRQAFRFAKRDGISLNQFLVSAIAEKVGAEDASTKGKFLYKRTISNLENNLLESFILCKYFSETKNTIKLSSNIPIKLCSYELLEQP